jgi:hypothetical protein
MFAVLNEREVLDVAEQINADPLEVLVAAEQVSGINEEEESA